MIENPPSFVVDSELYKAAFDNGFRLKIALEAGWLHYRSTTARGDLWIAAAGKSGPWYLSLSLRSVAAELGLPTDTQIAGPGVAHYAFVTSAELYQVLDRVYRLGVSLPDAPLKEFEAATKSTPRTTEAERLVVQRVGQDIFRKALLEYWNGCCPLTGITDPALLRASHIVPWSECESDALRLDVHNGFLLSALWDAAFDAGLVSFDDEGALLYSPKLTPTAQASLDIANLGRLSVTDAHRANLARHRSRNGF